MKGIRTWIAVGSVLFSGALACAEPGVTHVAPIPAGAGGMARPPMAAGTTAPAAGSGTISSPVTGAAGAPVAGAAVAAAGTGSPPTAQAGSSGTAGAAAPPTAAAGAGAGVAGVSGAAGVAASAGSPAAGGGAPAGAAGMPGPAMPGPCPSGWMCTDLASTGFVAKDGAGNDIAFSCGNGALAECDDANPKASCPGLSNPICAHLDIGGTQIVSCGQLCTP